MTPLEARLKLERMPSGPDKVRFVYDNLQLLKAAALQPEPTADERLADGLTGLAVALRAAQLYAHAAHNLVSGETFQQDHEWFGAAYRVYEEAYDAVVEHALSLGFDVDLVAVQQRAVAALAEMDGEPDDNGGYYDQLLEVEDGLRAAVEVAVDGASEATKNLLAGLAQDSQERTYKMGQRMKE